MDYKEVIYKDLNINWDEYIIPQIDGKDIKIFQDILNKKFDYTPLDPSEHEHTMFDGKVMISDKSENGTLICADADDERIKDVESAFDCWPEMRVMVSEMTDIFYPMYPANEDGSKMTESNIGCSCGIYGNAPYKVQDANDRFEISIMATINGAVGAAEGIVHELGHHKLHALGIHLEEYEQQFFTNGFDEVFPSPVRFDKDRPIAAVVQAEFSYIYVTEYYTKLLNWMLDNDMKEYDGHQILSYCQRQAYNLKRIGNGLNWIPNYMKLTEEGEKMMKSFMDYGIDVWTRGYRTLETIGVLDEVDWEPKDGIPIDLG